MNIRLAILLLCLTGCKDFGSYKEKLDQTSFALSGGTLFSEPTMVTTKEIHFDTGNLLGREIIIEGKIESLGKYDTHLVISDQSGRMLVVLTHIEEASDFLSRNDKGQIKVLGTVERGKKGLPYILASSLNLKKTETVQ